MKERFTAPELEIVRFDIEDVITTSPFTNGGQAGKIGGGSDITIP